MIVTFCCGFAVVAIYGFGGSFDDVMGMDRPSLRDVGRGGGARENVEIPMSSVTMSSVSQITFSSLLVESNLLSLNPSHIRHAWNFYKSILIAFKCPVLICLSNEFHYMIFHFLS